MKNVSVAIFAALLTMNAAHAGPKPAPGAETLCQGYEETIEGVWMDRSGVETLLFRYASNADERGCYAWLNQVAQWNIGTVADDKTGVFRSDGDKREMTRPDGGASIYLDLATGEARYVRNGRTTRGRVTSH